jgi:hypothetical protein
MRAGHVLLISAVVHGVLAAVLSQVVLDGKRVAHVTPPEPEPIDIAIIDESPPVPVPPASPSPATEHVTPAHRPGSSQATTKVAMSSSTVGPSSETSSGASEATSPTSDGTVTGHGYMRMRGAELGLDPRSAERIVEGGGHELPQETKPSGIMQHVSGGKAVIYDRVTTVSVEQDGTAHFADKPDIDVHLKLPIPHIDIEGMRKDLGEQLTKWYADPYAATRFGRTQDLSNINLAVPGACDEWGSVACDDPLAPDTEKYVREQKKTNGSLLGGAADISAYLHRKFVGDPYASRKKKLLDDTRDEREKMGSEFRAQQLQRSAELIARNLKALETARLDPIEVRAAAFELWDECSEPSEHADDDVDADAEGQAGLRARAQVLGWIRSHLPRTSPDAYTDEEIARLNLHRSSKQPFEPY